MTKDTMLTGLRFSQVRLIASYWVRFSLRTGGGLMALLFVLFVGISVAGVFFTPAEGLMNAAPELGHESREGANMVKEIAESEGLVSVVQWLTGEEETQAVYLLQKKPALLSVILLVLMWFFPFTSCIAGFNQTAGDIGSRGLRYLLLRTERPNVLLGRFLGTFYFVLISVAVVFVLIVFYIAFKFRIYPGGELVAWGLQGFLAILLLVLPYIAMCAWFSSMLDSAFGSLAVCLTAAGLPIIFLSLADKIAVSTDLSWLVRLIPWGWKYDLLAQDVGTRLLAYGVMLGFTALFLGLGFLTFSKRDL